MNICLAEKLSPSNIRMPNHDNIPTKRQKKSDKAKEKFERNGKFSAKHVRQTEALLAKNPPKVTDIYQRK